MNSLLERYLAGEHEQVWIELQELGRSALDDGYREAAMQVAAETMRRVQRNCEQIIERLKSLKYTFGVYPDGSKGYYSMGPLVTPDAEMLTDIATLRKAVGPLPLSLTAFWENVGSVDLVGMHSEWPRGLDPLVVEPPAAAVSDLDSMDEIVGSLGHFEASLAPDDLHKDNISGGDPYAVELPNAAADFVLLNERHHLRFVPYLRKAILAYGGFPGVEDTGAEPDFLDVLRDGLEPF